jgi:hypothetical protein
MGKFFYPETMKLTEINWHLILTINLLGAIVCVNVEHTLQGGAPTHFAACKKLIG